MECRIFALLMQRYYDGELGAVSRAEYEQHRRSCRRCRALDERYASVVHALDDLPVFEPSSDFNERVLACVDAAAYRKSAGQRFAGFLERAWNAIPLAARRIAVVAGVCTLVIAIYKPILDYIIRSVGLGAGGLWEGMLFVRDLLGKAAGVWKASDAVRNYEVVGETLMRTLHRSAAGLHPIQTVAIAALVIVAAVALIRMLGAVRRKGETNVCLL
jgi:hypothetical protein